MARDGLDFIFPVLVACLGHLQRGPALIVRRFGWPTFGKRTTLPSWTTRQITAKPPSPP